MVQNNIYMRGLISGSEPSVNRICSTDIMAQIFAATNEISVQNHGSCIASAAPNRMSDVNITPSRTQDPSSRSNKQLIPNFKILYIYIYIYISRKWSTTVQQTTTPSVAVALVDLSGVLLCKASTCLVPGLFLSILLKRGTKKIPPTPCFQTAHRCCHYLYFPPANSDEAIQCGIRSTRIRRHRKIHSEKMATPLTVASLSALTAGRKRSAGEPYASN